MTPHPSRAPAEADAPVPIVDAHQHFWALGTGRYPWLAEEPPRPFRYGDTRPLRADYLPADYRRDAAGWPIVATVHVEAEHDPRDPLGETRWLAALSAREGLPTALVAQAWLDREDVAEVLAAQAACPLVRGVRHKPAVAERPGDVRRGAPGSLDDPRWRAGYALLGRHGLSFDLQAPWWHLPQAAALAADFPGTTLVLNHTGLPADRGAEGLAGWRRALEALAAQPNAVCKISGLGRPGRPWSVEANGPVVRDALAIFGVERCLFASNYPVDRLVAPFGTIYAGFRAIVAGLPQAEPRALFHDNAVRVYRLASLGASRAASAPMSPATSPAASTPSAPHPSARAHER